MKILTEGIIKWDISSKLDKLYPISKNTPQIQKLHKT